MPAYTLPYRTDWQDMADLLDYAKGSGADRSALDARFGAGESMRETINALDQLMLVVRDDSGGVRLTEIGDRLAYAPDEAERIRVLVEALMAYGPYRMPFERALFEGMEVIEAPWVEHVWQVDMRLGQPRNRVAEARTFFFRLAAAAGLGTYRRGVRGQTTRLELAPNVKDVVGPFLSQPAGRAQRSERRADSGAGGQGARDQSAKDQSEPSASRYNFQMPVAVDGPALSITVDMSDWDLDRIEAFLRLIGYPIGE